MIHLLPSPSSLLILYIADVIAAAHLCINIFNRETHKKHANTKENQIYSVIIVMILQHEIAKLSCCNVWFVVASIFTSTLVHLFPKST